MDQTKIDMFISSNKDKFPSEKIGIIQNQLEKIDERKFLGIQAASYKSPMTLLIVSIFLGGLGVDRFMLGQTGAGIGKLLTCGGSGVWWLIDLFLISKEAKDYNFILFTQVSN